MVKYPHDVKVYDFVKRAQAHWRNYEFRQAREVGYELNEYAEKEGFKKLGESRFVGVSDGVQQELRLVLGVAADGYSLALQRRDLRVKFLLQIEACEQGDLRRAYLIGVYCGVDSRSDKAELFSRYPRIEDEGWTDSFEAEIAKFLTPELKKKFTHEREEDARFPEKRDTALLEVKELRRIMRARRDTEFPNTWRFDGATLSMVEDLHRRRKGFSPELAEAMRDSARRAKEENINIDDPIEGYVGL